ncbi:MAG TPA: peptidoglycan DD-metalloendopeptidase family protein [Thermoguttaceae bacterium]
MKAYKTFCLFFVVSVLARSVYAAEPADRFQKVADRMVKAYNKKDYPGMCQDFAKLMSDALPLEKSTPFFKQLMSDCGKITKLDGPKIIPPDQAIFPAHFERATLDIKIVLDNQDKIIGLWFLPHTPDIPVPEKHETKLRLPFEGDWSVYWGGDIEEVNAHHNTQNQRYAFDFLIADDQGKTYNSDGMQNKDYYAFGLEVLAPADGEVTEVIQGVRDNTPRSMNPYSALGNAVVIKHKENEVSVLGHFKQGSILVKPGKKVKKGQVLGLCGNSGNSSEPHIHYHLQNTPIIQDGMGIKVFFDNVAVIKEGIKTTQKHYSPIKSDIVSPK